MPGFQGFKNFFDLNPVSAYVLHGTGAYTSGDQGKIFYPGPVVLKTKLHKAMPDLPCTGFYVNMIGIFFYEIQTWNIVFQHQPVYMIFKKNITPAPNNEGHYSRIGINY